MSKGRRVRSRREVVLVRALVGVAAFGIATMLILGVSQSFIFKERHIDTTAQRPFPLSVDPKKQLVAEEPILGTLVIDAEEPEGRLLYISQLQKAFSKLVQFGWYQNLASPKSRILVIVAGERREQIVDNFGDILRWDEGARRAFEAQITSGPPTLADGTFYPGHYLVHKDATPSEVAALVQTRFDEYIGSRYSPEVEEFVPIETALIVASLLEREAYDFEDMRRVSGVIWNRLFLDMPLQLDATLQYVRGSLPYEPWWPSVSPDDKFIDSPFNTYAHAGLPPSPIANVRDEAVIAALNPIKTDCLFYFHDDAGVFSCTETYEEHVENLTRIYGQGR